MLAELDLLVAAVLRAADDFLRGSPRSYSRSRGVWVNTLLGLPSRSFW